MNTLCCLLAAFNATVGELPPCAYADTECSTNVPVTVDFAAMDRVAIALSLDASPSNAVEIAIGSDADGDGSLSVEESDYAFGYDCGTWFCRDTVRNRLDVLGEETSTALPTSNRVERTFVLRRSAIKSGWNLVKATRRGTAPLREWASVKGFLNGLRISIR